jgi:hypothetical protein
MRDGRAERRRTIISRVELRWQDSAGTAMVSTALLEDRSKQGASIRVTDPIVAGTRLQVVNRREDFVGLVRYCRPDGSGYLIGIRQNPPAN